MYVSVSEFSRVTSLSGRRVIQLIKAGKIRAHRSGGVWLVDRRDLKYRSAIRRPLSQKNGAALISLLSGFEWESNLDAKSRARIRGYFKDLVKGENPSALLASWYAGWFNKKLLKVNKNDLFELRADKRITLSGISDVRSGIADSNQIQAIVDEKILKTLVKEYLLIPSIEPNVQFRIYPVEKDQPAPLAITMIDLAEENGVRENGQLIELVRSIPNPKL